MKHFFSVILICLCTSIYSQSKFFFHVNGSLNMTYRDLSSTGKTSNAMKQYFEARKNAEKIAFGERFGVGVGMLVNSKIQIQTEFFYKHFGDIEKDELITFNEKKGTYESIEKGIRHSYYHVGIPISLDYYIIKWKGWDFGWRISPEINYLLDSKYSVKKGENVFGDPIGYPYYFTDTNRLVFGFETGGIARHNINDKTCINVNLLYNQHLNYDFEREYIVNQRNYSIGLKFAINYFF